MGSAVNLSTEVLIVGRFTEHAGPQFWQRDAASEGARDTSTHAFSMLDQDAQVVPADESTHDLRNSSIIAPDAGSWNSQGAYVGAHRDQLFQNAEAQEGMTGTVKASTVHDVGRQHLRRKLGAIRAFRTNRHKS